MFSKFVSTREGKIPEMCILSDYYENIKTMDTKNNFSGMYGLRTLKVTERPLVFVVNGISWVFSNITLYELDTYNILCHKYTLLK